MSEGHQPECYGRIFPDVLHLPEGRPSKGTVFAVKLQRVGGMFSYERSVTADMGRWNECRHCPEFDGCYMFSMAKLAMESADHAR
jgi:hypothetical protein